MPTTSMSIKTFIKEIIKLFQGDTNKGRIFKGSLGSLIINGGNKVFVVITGIILVRVLGKVEYGIYSYLFSLAQILVIPAQFGLSNLIIRETAKGSAKQQYSKTKGVWLWSFRNAILFYFAIILLAVIASFFVKGHFSQVEMSTYYWAIGLTPILASLYVASAALQGLKKVVLGQVSELIIMQSSFILLFAFFAYLTPFVPSAASTMVLRFAAIVIGFVFTITFFLKETPHEISSTKPVYSGKFWLISTISLGLSGGFNTTKTLLVTLFMGFFVGKGDIGTFQVAVSAAALAGLALQAVNAILAPQFASLIAKNDKSRLQRLVSISSFIVGIFCLVTTLVFVLIGKPLLGFVFGKDLVEAYPSLLILLGGQLVNSFAGSVGYLLNMAGHENDVLKTIIISTVMNIVLTLLLTPFWGIIGGATASSISLIYSQISMYRLVHKRLGIISHALGLFTISWNKKDIVS